MENPVIFVLAAGILLTDIAILGYLALKVLKQITLISLAEKVEDIDQFLIEKYRELGLFFAAIATSGSLYMSNILGWTPCRLCWFQRILMYPLVLLFGISLFLEKDSVSDYTLPMALIGSGIAGYHYIIQRISQFHSAGCSVLEVSCETKYTFYFGYVSVPMMAFTAFVAILIISYLAYQKQISN